MSRTSEKSRVGLRSPTCTTGSRSPASISAICLAKLEVAKAEPRRGPVWLNARDSRSRRPWTCSVLLRYRPGPLTSTPRSSAYSSRWLPTKPVMPVSKMRIVVILLHPARRACPARDPAERLPPGSGQGEHHEGPQSKERAPPGIGAAPHRAPAHPRLGAEPVVVADGG